MLSGTRPGPPRRLLGEGKMAAKTAERRWIEALHGTARMERKVS